MNVLGALNPAVEEDVITIEGTVAKILYKNEANNYVIVSVKASNPEVIPDFAANEWYPGRFVAIGNFMRISQGQKFILKGKWTRHPQYGGRFQVESYEEIVPTDLEALIEYLSSGLFKGIGRKTAASIVQAFGEKTLDVIKNHPEKLTTVKGISDAKASIIVRSYKESEHLERLMLSLKPFNISTKKIIKIYQRYGENAIEKIIENPYWLCDEIEGIGFRTADAIAKHCGIAPNDDYRIRAGIIYTLHECAQVDGHVYLPFEVMVQKTKEVLMAGEITGDVDKNSIIRVAIDMNNSEELVIEKDGAVYLPFYHGAEIYVAKKLQILLETKPRKFIYDMDEVISELEKKHKIQYAPKQKEAFYTLPKTNVMVITGGPGTGKTTIIKGIIDIFKKNFPGSKISLAAPTGRAAKRMEEATGVEAKTIHRLLEYRPTEELGICCGRNEYNPLDADLIIIDESSMIDLLLCATFLKAVKPSTLLIFVGDIDQLPSVGAGNVLKDIIDSGKIPVVRLNEIFRQKDTSRIIINAAKINRGETDLDFGDDFVFVEEEDIHNIPNIIKNEFRDALVEVRDINEIQVITPFRKRTETGVERLNQILQQDLNPKRSNETEIHYGSNTFRKYDKVMQYKNNYEKQVFNGDVGIIHEVDPNNGILKVMINDEMVEYHKDELDELQLAYATTIHKSQGCEYHTVIIPISMQHKRMLQRNLIYTGITRAKEKVILIGQKKALNYAIRNNKVSSRFTKLAKRI